MSPRPRDFASGPFHLAPSARPPGSRLRISHHCAAAWHTCRMLWYHSYLRAHPTGGRGWEPLVPGDALRFGTMMHAGWEAYYEHGGSLTTAQFSDRRGQPMTPIGAMNAGIDAIRAAGAESPANTPEERATLATNAEVMLRMYGDYYGPGGVKDESGSFTVARDAYGHLLEAAYEVDLGYANYAYIVRLDMEVEHAEYGRAAWENKTASARSEAATMRRLRDTDGQITGELFAKRTRHADATGVVLNIGVKDRGRSSDRPPFTRGFATRTDEQLEAHRLYLVRTCREIDAHIEEYHVLLATGRPEPQAALWVFSRTGFNTGHCIRYADKRWDCEFLPLCLHPGYEVRHAANYKARG